MPSEGTLITFEGDETTTDILNMLPEDQQSELQLMMEDTAQRLERMEIQTQAAQDAAPEGSEEVEYQYGPQGDEEEEENTEVTVSESHPSVEDEIRDLDRELVQPPTTEVDQEVNQQPEDEDQLTGAVQEPQKEQIPDSDDGSEEPMTEYRPADEVQEPQEEQTPDNDDGSEEPIDRESQEEAPGESDKSEGEAMGDQPTGEVQGESQEEEEPDDHDDPEREAMKIGEQPTDETQSDQEHKNEQAPGDSGHESEGEPVKSEEAVSPELVNIDSTIG